MKSLRLKQRSGRRAKRARVAPGAAPGTILIDPESPHPSIRVMAYGPEQWIEEEVEGPGGIERFLGRWPVLWVNVDGLGDEQTLRSIGRVFDLHRLAVEDVAHVGQRAKIEAYPDHLFLVARMAYRESPRDTEQLSLFLGQGFVLTFQETRGDCFEPIRTRIREGQGKLMRQFGADYLAYALLDAVLDGYFPVLDSIDDRLDALEEEIFTAPSKETAAHVQELTTDLRVLRRAALPHTEVTHALLKQETPFIRDETRIYLRDCSDHAIRITEMADSYREFAADLMAAYLSGISNRMNEVMKVLTLIASIFIPLSFIAGLYGMNFDPGASRWNMPELGHPFGYPAVLLLMALVAGGMLLFFKRKRWLE